ncbi:MAG TPA: phosphatase PAP2 family protein [Candidatus Saccharimonadales bacterium]|nr:phosphatase PAP2 family protein [Candidatus Saccharimonadales bacterium]
MDNALVEGIFLKIIADWLVVPIVLVGVVAMLRQPKSARYQIICRGLVAGLATLLGGKIGSLFYQGERPFVHLGQEAKAAFLDNPGFPSDHTLLVFAVTLIVWASTKNVALSLLLLFLSVLVAIGRVAALVHSPTDVIGGMVFAFIAVVAVYGGSFFSTKKWYN